MRHIVAFVLVLVWAGAVQASSGVSGTWNAKVDEDRPERVQFFMLLRHGGNNGESFRLADLTGLTSDQIHSTARAPVQFELRREPGTVAFEGTFRGGEGAGSLSFAPDRQFPQKLRALGVPFTSKHGDDIQELFMMTLFDLNTDYIRSMQAIGYNLSIDEYIQCRIFSVDPDYVRDMASVGFDHLPSEKLVETRIHGATPEYIRRMRASGQRLTLDEYIESRIFKVTPEFQEEMAHAGYPNLDHDTLTQFRIHGVTPAFIRELREAGYTHVPADELVQMRIFKVTPEFIRRVEATGYHHVPVEKLVQMRIFNIKPELVKALDDEDTDRR